MIFDVLLRLEPDPHQRDLARGWAAELADPAWLLGRQWQMGEHQGEDASSPVAVEIRSRATPIGAVAGQAGLDPATVPAQAIIESEPQRLVDTRPPGPDRPRRRAPQRHKRTASPCPTSATLTGLPVPYQDLNGTGPDGRALWQQRSQRSAWTSRGSASPARRRDEPVDLWDPAELAYTAELPAGDTTLTITRHDGGDLDWYHADATAPLSPPPQPRHRSGSPPAACATRARRCPGGGRSRTPRSPSAGRHPTGPRWPRSCSST